LRELTVFSVFSAWPWRSKWFIENGIKTSRHRALASANVRAGCPSPGARPSPGAATLPTKPSSKHPRRIAVRPLLRPGTAALRLRFAVAADVSRLKLLPRWNNERIDPACGTATILEWGARPSRSPFSASRRKPVNKLICPTMFRARRPKLHARRVRSHNHNFNTSLPSQPSRETQRRPLCVKPLCGR